MPETPTLKQQLQSWAQAYGGPQLAHFGYAAQEKLAGGAAPASGNPDADRIETIVRRMEQQGRWYEARVLRAEHFMKNLPERERLQRLSRIGVRIGRSAYYAYLKSAIAFLEGATMGEPS
jgi:hypothetical protein